MGIKISDETIEKFYPFGYTAEKEALVFCAAFDCKELEISVYRGGRKVFEAAFPDEYRLGAVRRVALTGIPLDGSCSYTYIADGEERAEPYGLSYEGRDEFGAALDKVPRAVIEKSPLLSFKTRSPIPYEETVIYRLHVRGFTKDRSSKVAEEQRGTFDGVRAKLPYLKDLGITTIELMPPYEYDEGVKSREKKKKINYWGFTDEACRLAPKAAFGGEEGFLRLINAIHKEGMELIVSIYLSGEEAEDYVLAVMRSWRLRYGVDGVHIVGRAPVRLLLCDPYLKGMKLLADDIRETDLRRDGAADALGLRRKTEACDCFGAVYNDDYQNKLRRFIKGDEGMIGDVIELFKRPEGRIARIDYAANVSGFTLMDVFSYDRKHNEQNEEHGTDGTDLNYSWNCGEEGPSRKKRVNELRRRLYKNALTLTILSGGTPLINSGDEMCHSKKGNNNSWCMDSRIEWINWADLDKNRDIYEFLRGLIKLRKEHPILRPKKSLTGSDRRMTGLPDISFHGSGAWRVDYEPYRRQLGICLNGDYAERTDETSDDCFYIGMNMHWESHISYLPKLPAKKRWYLLTDTSDPASEVDETKLYKLDKQDEISVNPRSIVILIGK